MASKQTLTDVLGCEYAEAVKLARDPKAAATLVLAFQIAKFERLKDEQINLMATSFGKLGKQIRSDEPP